MSSFLSSLLSMFSPCGLLVGSENTCNVALQVFSLPTKSPHGLNIESNEDKNDDIFWLAIVDRWPPATWNSLSERALYQARRLHQFARGSRGGFVVIESAADLSGYLDRRRLNGKLTAVLLSIEA